MTYKVQGIVEENNNKLIVVLSVDGKVMHRNASDIIWNPMLARKLPLEVAISVAYRQGKLEGLIEGFK